MIRIDGSTPIPQRHLAIRRFNTERSLRVALVSVTAASLGVDLSAASTCIFAELPPTLHGSHKRRTAAIVRVRPTQSARQYLWRIAIARLPMISTRCPRKSPEEGV